MSVKSFQAWMREQDKLPRYKRPDLEEQQEQEEEELRRQEALKSEGWYTGLDRKVGGLLPGGISGGPSMSDVGSWIDRAGQTGAEIMTTVDNLDKASTGNKYGDLSADLWGGLMGFAVNPVGGVRSAGAQLFGAGEKAIEKGLSLIPAAERLPGIARTGLKLGGATIPYEATMAAVNDREFSPGEAGMAGAANAGLGMLLHGAGSVLNRNRGIKTEPAPMEDAVLPETTPIPVRQKEIAKPIPEEDIGELVELDDLTPELQGKGGSKAEDIGLKPEQAGTYDPGTIGAAKLTLPEKQSVLPGTNEKVRSFQRTAIDAPVTDDMTKAGLLVDIYSGGPGAYKPITNLETEAAARKFIEDNGIDAAINRVMDKTETSAEQTALAGQVTYALQKQGKHEQALNMLESLADQLTAAGQKIQAVKIFQNLSPEGVLIKAQKETKKAFNELPQPVKQRHDNLSNKLQQEFDNVNKQAVDQVISDNPQLTGIPEIPEVPEVPQSPETPDVPNVPGVPGETKQPTNTKGKKKQLSPADILAQRVKQHVTEAKEGEPDPIKDLINTLFKSAEEVLPKRAKRVPRDEMELINQAITQKQGYREVWNGAKEALKEKYGDNPDVMNSVESFIEHYLDIPYSENAISKVTKTGIKDNDIKLADIVRKHYTEVTKTGNDLISKLVSAGLPKQDAEILALEIGGKFGELVTAKKQQILDQMFKQKGKTKQKPIDQKLIEMSNLGAFSKEQYRRAVAEKLNLPVLTEDIAKTLTELAEKAQMAEGREAEILRAQMVKIIAEQTPTPFWRKVASIQTMAQLLNPKTAIRNIGGNAGFNVLENVSDVIGAGIDKGVSLATGKRSKVLPSITAQGKGFMQGGKEGIQDAMLGIDTTGFTGKFDLPKGRVFKGGIMGKMETALNIELKATDRAFYKAAYEGSLKNQMVAAKVTKPTEKMLEAAHLDGLYRTFQDDNALSKLFVTIKRSLNGLTGGEFGAGDFLVKYPKTPANLLMRGIEYSPAGFVKTIIEAARPLAGREFNQKAFVESFSRALVGSTALFGTGVLLHKLGIITGRPNADQDLAALERQNGFGEYRINVSALKRLAFGDGNTNPTKGDNIISWDWFQPAAIPLAIGADVDANKGKATGIVGTILNALGTGINAFAEQPVMQGIQTAFSGQRGDATAGVSKVLQGIPASFVPTLLNQIKQLADNQQRETYSPNWQEQAMNKVKGRIPGMSNDLPQKYGTLGQPLETYQNGGNSPGNVFLNPAFMNEYNPSPAVQKVKDIHDRTGETKQVPRVADKSIKVGEQVFQLTGEEFSEYQRLLGEKTDKGFSKVNVGKTDKSAENAVGKMQGIMNKANQDAKLEILKSMGLKASKKGSGIALK